MLVVIKSLRVNNHGSLSMTASHILLMLKLLYLRHLLLVLEPTEKTHFVRILVLIVV